MSGESRRRTGGMRLLRFSIAAAGTAVLWLVVLPAVSRHPVVQQHIRRNQEQHIDPSAMFYTEVGQVRGVQLRYVEGNPRVERFQVGH